MSDASRCDLNDAQIAMLRRLAGGRKVIPKRDDDLAAEMEGAGLIDSAPGTRTTPDRRHCGVRLPTYPFGHKSTCARSTDPSPGGAPDVPG